MEKERDKERSSVERETNELHYHGWLEIIYKEIRNIHLKSSSNPSNVYKIMDKFIEYFRAYFRRNPQEKSKKMYDYYLARATNRLMFLFRDLIPEENDHEYLLKISELLGGCTALWLRYYSTEDRKYGETHIESILNCYAFYLQSTTDESFLLKVFAHVLFANRKLPQLFSKVLEKHLKKRAQRKGRRDQEVKEDQLYILYIIGFKLWDDLRPKGDISIGDIPKYANDFIKPMTSILSNHRYAPYLPSITSSDIEDGKATRIILTKFQSRYLYKLAEAVVKEDWLRGSNINTPIIVDLSIEDEVNKGEQLEINKVDSVGPELKSLSLDDRNARLSKELWWVEILQKKALKTLKSDKENYKVVEIIELDDEETPETKNNIVTENVTELNKHSTKEVGKDIPNDLKSKALNQNEKDNINENEIFTQTELKHENLNESDERVVVQDEEAEVEIISEKEQDVINLDMPIIQEKEKNKKGIFTQTELKHENINKRNERVVVQDEEAEVEIIPEREQDVINLDMPIIQEKEKNKKGIFTQTELKHENINKRNERVVVQDDEAEVEIISEKEQDVINLDMPIIQEKEKNKKLMNHDEDEVIEIEEDVVTIETESVDKEMMDGDVEEVKKECNGDNINQDTTKNTEKKNKERMDIEVEEKNEVTSKDNANKLVPTAKTSGKLSSEITLSDESTSKTFVQDSKSEAPNSPEVCTSEVRTLCSKLITLDIQEHFKNRLDMEEEIEKRVNEIVSKEANNAESQENLCDDEKPLSIICIEDTKPKSPLLLTDTSENEMESATKSEIIMIEGNTSTTNENLVIDESLNHTCTPKSPQTSETVKCYQGNNKGSSDPQLDIGNDNDSLKNCSNKITSDKEIARNTNTPEISDNEGTTPHSTDDDDHMSMSSIVDESETYDNVDPKVDDVHIEKISPHRIEETTINSEKSTPVLFSVATVKKLSPLSEYPDNFQEEPKQNHRVVFSTSTANVRQKRSASPNYAFSPSPEHYQLRYPTEVEEIKSPPVESFSKSDTDEFKKLFNKSYTETNCVEKDSCSDQDEPVSNAYTSQPPNFMSERTSQRVPKRSILSKTDGHIQSENISSSTKRKAVSFATITQEKPPLIVNRDMNLGSTILERKTYDSPITVQTEQQSWRPSINTPSVSNQQVQPQLPNEQEQELDILSTSGVNSFGSASPPLIKDSGREKAGSLINKISNKTVLNKVFVQKDDYTNTDGKHSQSYVQNAFADDEKAAANETKKVINGNVSLLNRRNLLKADNFPLKSDGSNLPKDKPFVKEINISINKAKSDIEALKQISTKQFKPYDSMSDFDRYLVERKRISLEKNKHLPDNPSNSNDVPNNIDDKKSDQLKRDSKMTHSFVKLCRYDTKTVKENREWLNGPDIKLLKSFNDPKLKKKVFVKLNRHNYLEIEELQKLQHKNRSFSEPLSPRTAHKTIEIVEKGHDNKKLNSASLELNRINNNENIEISHNERNSTEPKGIIHESTHDANVIRHRKSIPTSFWSFPKHKNAESFLRAENGISISSKTILKDKCNEMTDLKSIFVKKRRSSVDSVIVVRVFADKNKKQPNSGVSSPKRNESVKQPLVLVKRIKNKYLSQYNVNDDHKIKKRHKNKKRDQSRHRSKSRRKSQYENIADTEYESEKRSRSRSRKGMFIGNENDFEMDSTSRNRMKSKSTCEELNEFSEVDFFYPSSKKRNRSRSSSQSHKNRSKTNIELYEEPKSRNRIRSKSACEELKEFSEVDFFYPSSKKRNRSRSSSQSRKNDRKTNTELYEDPTFSPISTSSRSTSRSKSNTTLKSSLDFSIDMIKQENSPITTRSKSKEDIRFDMLKQVNSSEEIAKSEIFPPNPMSYEGYANSEVDGSINLCIRDQKSAYDTNDITRYNTPEIFKNSSVLNSDNLYTEDELVEPVSPYTLPLDLSKKFYSPQFPTDDRITLSSSLEYYDSSTSYYRFESEMNSDNVDELFDEFSSQLCHSTVPEREFTATQENANESESPLVILSNPNEGVFVSELLNVNEARGKKSHFSSSYSCCSSDTADLAIFPKRRKVLDSVNVNDSTQDEDGHTFIYTTEGMTESVIRRHYVHQPGDNRQLAINGTNSIYPSISGTVSPEINVNMDVAKTYSKNNLVQNVFVPPELEMNFEDPTKISKFQFIRKGRRKKLHQLKIP